VSTFIVRLTLALVILAVVAAEPAPAQASAQALRRSAENIIWSPFDLASTPVLLGYTMVRNFYASKKYSLPQKLYLSPPALLYGSVFVVTTSVGGAFARGAAGLIEMPVGIGALVLNKDPAPFYDTGGMKALVNYPNDIFTVRFAINQIAD
jgi:hypothetical protein